jgi:hypothetical protein
MTDGLRRGVAASFALLLLAAGATTAARGQGSAPPPDAQPAAPAAAQEAAANAVDPIGTRWINTSSPHTTPEHNLELIFTHRFLEAVQDGSGHDLWGLDSAAAVGIGLTYGLHERLDVSIFRATTQEDFEFALKGEVLRQDARMPLTASLRVGLDYPNAKAIEDRSRPFAQLLLGRRMAPGWNVMVAPSWVRDTATLRNAWNVPLGLTVPLPHEAMLAVEVVPRNHDADRDRQTAWAVAFVKDVGRHITGGHLFKITLGNASATTVDQILGSDPPQTFRRGDVRIGFNLVRDFQL